MNFGSSLSQGAMGLMSFSASMVCENSQRELGGKQGRLEP